MMLVSDPGLGKGRLQPERVRPGVLRSADTTTLPHIKQHADIRQLQPPHK
jgi:hypothetical protein